MPTLESNRRIIARGMIQLYATDDEGGESMIDTGIISTTSTSYFKDVGFTPKAIFLSYEITEGTKTTYIKCNEGIARFRDYDVADFTNTDRTVVQQRIYIENNVDSIIEIVENGFISSLGSGTGFYIAIG